VGGEDHLQGVAQKGQSADDVGGRLRVQSSPQQASLRRCSLLSIAYGKQNLAPYGFIDGSGSNLLN